MQATKTLAAACNAQDWALAARYIAYRGSNDSRDFKDTFKPEVQKELDEIVDVCGAFDEMELARGFKVKSYQTETESEGKWHILVVNGAEGEAALAFLLIKGRYALGDID